MIHPPVPPGDWAAEGEKAAAALEEVAAALVIGSDSEIAAVVARAIADAQPDARRVAIGDLVGDLRALRPPRGLIATLPDGTTGDVSAPRPDGAPHPGLLQCFRDGLSVSAIARPLTVDGRIFALPSGGPGVRDRFVVESARWTRLIAGFREVDALLLLVADARTPGLEALMGAVDGVVAVDLAPAVVRSWPLLATVDRPEPELPPVLPARPLPARGRTSMSRAVVAAMGIAMAAAAGAVAWFAMAAPSSPSTADGSTARAAGASGAEPVDGAAGTVRDPRADTITLGAVVNPDDSSRAAAFTVELVAANTLAGANSAVAMRGVTLPAPTLAPVLIGADGRPWYRALTGAWRDRPEAEAFLATLRDRGLVREDVGRVLRAPYALLLAEGVPPGAVAAALAQWEARGIPAYALQQSDGRARVFAGAFETPGQSALVALSLRDLGVTPVLAFRTGRTF